MVLVGERRLQRAVANPSPMVRWDMNAGAECGRLDIGCTSHLDRYTADDPQQWVADGPGQRMAADLSFPGRRPHYYCEGLVDVDGRRTAWIGADPEECSRS